MNFKSPVNWQKLLEYQTELLKDENFKVSLNALANNSIETVSLNQQIVKQFQDEYSHNIKSPNVKVTDQENSGRCWIFAILNIIRGKFINDFNLENFEFSQAYLHFWDKFEKANVFLNQMINLAETPLEDRIVFTLLKEPIQDSGFFDWAKNLILKYGIVPKQEMDDSFSSTNTLAINKFIDIKLKQAVIEIRKVQLPSSNVYENQPCSGKFFSDLANQELIRNDIKCKYLFEIYQMLVKTYGLPPKKFDLTLKDKENKVQKFYGLTPLTFFEKIGFKLNEYVSIVHTPYQKIKPFQNYELDYVSAMIEKGNITFTTVDYPTFQLMVLSMIFAKKSVWFACDVNHFYSNKKGIWANNLYDFDTFFNLEFSHDISQQIEYHQITTNHAMVLQGFDYDQKHWDKIKSDFFNEEKNKSLDFNDFKKLINLIPISRWNVENSWGEKVNKGSFSISNDWFANYVYEIVIDKKIFKDFLKNPSFLTEDEYKKFSEKNDKVFQADYYYQEMLQKALDTQPIKLALWDPFNEMIRGK